MKKKKKNLYSAKGYQQTRQNELTSELKSNMEYHAHLVPTIEIIITTVRLHVSEWDSSGNYH